MNADLAQALHVQELDLRIRELKREIATLPRQLAEIEKHLEEHTRRLDIEKAALAANLKDRKTHEADIATHQQKISKLKDQMMQAKTNEQLWAFQKEISFHEAEISKSEDRILELMMSAEKLETKVKASEAALAEERKTVEAKKADTSRRTDEDKRELATVAAERKAAAAAIPAKLLQTYEKLHARMADGVAIVEAAEGICTGCQMTLRQQLLSELRVGEKILACESCRRLIFIASRPVDIEAQMNG